MTSEQCHANHYHSQQVEGSARWDRHLSETCAIDRWTAKMKRTEGYITREISWRRGRQFGRRQEILLVEYQKRRSRNHPRPRTEDELWPFPQPRYRWSNSPTIQFSSSFLYQIHSIGPVGFGFAHIYSERNPLNPDPTIFIYELIKLNSLTLYC